MTLMKKEVVTFGGVNFDVSITKSRNESVIYGVSFPFSDLSKKVEFEVAVELNSDDKVITEFVVSVSEKSYKGLQALILGSVISAASDLASRYAEKMEAMSNSFSAVVTLSDKIESSPIVYVADYLNFCQIPDAYIGDDDTSILNYFFKKEVLSERIDAGSIEDNAFAYFVDSCLVFAGKEKTPERDVWEEEMERRSIALGELRKLIYEFNIA